MSNTDKMIRIIISIIAVLMISCNKAATDRNHVSHTYATKCSDSHNDKKEKGLMELYQNVYYGYTTLDNLKNILSEYKIQLSDKHCGNEPWLRTANCYSAMTMYDDAQNILKQREESICDDKSILVEIALYRGYIYEESGDKSKASKQYTRAKHLIETCKATYEKVSGHHEYENFPLILQKRDIIIAKEGNKAAAKYLEEILERKGLDDEEARFIKGFMENPAESHCTREQFIHNKASMFTIVSQATLDEIKTVSDFYTLYFQATTNGKEQYINDIEQTYLSSNLIKETKNGKLRIFPFANERVNTSSDDISQHVPTVLISMIPNKKYYHVILSLGDERHDAYVSVKKHDNTIKIDEIKNLSKPLRVVSDF